ncbi:MAG: tetratricopeptide repeat protein, partial [Acetatifactor sp.]|nr:tetratricopeptide repeat protein [Acetatifactor sp.]
LERALEIGDRSGAVTLLNELIGFCRETGQAEKSYYYGEAVLNLLQEMGLSGTLPFATSVLNIASAYRAGGRLEDAMTCYRAVEQIYSQALEPDDMLVASLYNNKALLYQEMGEFEAAGAYLEQALEIALRYPERYYEQASSYANLAATYLQLGKKEQAEDCFQRAIALFEAHGVRDAHYCAALSSMAAYLFQQGAYQEAETYFVRAMQGVEESLGRTEAYYRLRDNAEACRRAAEEQEGAQTGHSDVREQGSTGAAQQGGQPRAGQQVSGMELCRAYYETYGRAMIHEKFPEYEGCIAVGLAGEGSDCFDYDDETSRDHDWGPSFMMWVSDEVYAEIGERLQAAYEELPQTFLGYTYQASRQGAGRRGVQTVRGFYGRLL